MKTLAQLQELLQQNIAEKKQEMLRLQREVRIDEAVHCRIALNVLEIFHTVAGVAQKQGSEEAAAAFFQKKLADIPAEWQAAQQKAAAAGDDSAVFVQQLKLDAAALVKQLLD